MKKYYLELVDKYEECNFVFQSKWFNNLTQLEKWIAHNVDFIDFNKYYADIMYCDFKKHEAGDIFRYGTLTRTEFAELKMKYPIKIK